MRHDSIASADGSHEFVDNRAFVIVDVFSKEESQMAKKVVFVSDLSGREIGEGSAVKITVTFSDQRRGQYVLDAHPDDAEVQMLVGKGTKQARRGRPRKSTE
jgi:uncharacterized protein YxjI